MKNEILETALRYSKRGFSIIPVGKDKKPLIKWEPFQKRKASEQEIEVWWREYPKANIGIVTGSISGVSVIDIDEPKGNIALEAYIPFESYIIPSCITPRGGYHLYFKTPDLPLNNNSRLIPGTDFRGEGGYVLAPPSQNGAGKPYAWLEGLSIDEVEPPPLPLAYISFIKSIALGSYSSSLVLSSSLYREVSTYKSQEVTEVSTSIKMFTHGTRDNDLFHVANYLAKSRMPESEIRQVIEILAKNCEPPFSGKEAEEKIESALKRAEKRERKIAEDFREWLESQEGLFLVSEFYRESQVVSKEEKHATILEVKRLLTKGVIQKCGERRGCYRTISKDCADIDIFNASDEGYPLVWPLGIENLVTLMPKNIAIISGEANAGKSAFMLNLAQMNCARYDTYYFSSEMGGQELKKRIKKFAGPFSFWKQVHFKERSANFSDVIVPDALNIIDFLEIHDEFWKVGAHIRDIWEKLNKGVAIISIQKNPVKEFGTGGYFGMEKARLYLSVEHGNPYSKAKILKAKNWATEDNPNGKVREFKLVNGCDFHPQGGWEREN